MKNQNMIHEKLPQQRNLGFELITLSKIFDNFSFRVPDYQRGYSWELKHVNALLRDINQLLRNEKSGLHYTGTLVLSWNAPARYDVVDGQQRLTTLVILLHALTHKLKSNSMEYERLHSHYLWRGDAGNLRLALELGQDSHRFFERLLAGTTISDGLPIQLGAHQRLHDAWVRICNWVHEFEFTELMALVGVVENRLGFMIYSPKNDGEIGIMFEVINNRGKPLSELEKVKNYLIYCCSKLDAKATRERINQDWADVLHNLNRAGKTSVADEESFLRYCAVVALDLGKKDSQSVYDEMRDSMSIDDALDNELDRQEAVKRIESFVLFLQLASVWYVRLYHPDHEQVDSSLKPVFDQLRAQRQHASIMPLFLAVVIRLSGDIPTLLRLLRLIECLNFRVYMAKNATRRNDSGHGDLYRYASKFYHKDFREQWFDIGGVNPTDSFERALEFLLVQFTLTYSTDERFMKSLTLEEDEDTFDFYNWVGLRYFLMNYEAELQPKKTIPIDRILLARQPGKSNDYFSVEHIWATKNRENENDRRQDLHERRRLGNFVLLELGINVQGSDHDLTEKISTYRDRSDRSELKQVRLMCKDADSVINQLCEEDWKQTKNYYTERQKRLNDSQEYRYQKFARDRWSIKEFEGYKAILKQRQSIDE